MIAQWENDCISLSVLSVARVMVAQWENECISVSVLSMAWVMIAQLHSSLSVLPVARAMIAQWDNSLSVRPVARAQFPAMAEYVKRFFSWLITCAASYTVHGAPKIGVMLSWSTA